VATFLLFLCIAAGLGVIGILFMLYGPTTSGFARPRIAASSGPTLGFSFAPPPPPPVYAIEQQPFVPVQHSLSTDFSVEEQVREVRIRAKSPSPPPLPPVTPPPLPKVRAEATPTSPPRLGVSAPARGRHLEPPRRMPPPMPRTRSARGSDGPPIATFSTENQRTVPRERDEFSTAEHTFVD
jgi:hypothetical protein